jgi:hypothetical protein
MAHRSFATSVLATSLVALVSAPPVWAGIQPQPFRTGLFGVAPGQAIRVSVLNGGERGVINPCVEPTTTIAAAVRIRGQRGTVLFRSRTEKVLEGEGTFIDFLPFAAATDSTGARTPGDVLLPANRRLQCTWTSWSSSSVTTPCRPADPWPWP